MDVRYCGLDISSSEDGSAVEQDASRLSDLATELEASALALEAPESAAIARSRLTQSNVSATPQKRGDERVLKKKSVLDRVSEFLGEMLERSDGRLFCSACREWTREKKSNVIDHVNSKKHAAAKQIRLKEKIKEQSMRQALERWDKEKRPVGGTLPLAVRAYRLNVVRTFMKEEIPLDRLRDSWKRMVCA